MEMISWTDRVQNKEVLERVKEERNFLHTAKQRNANWIGHILRRNCLLKRVIEGKTKGWNWQEDEEYIRSYWMTFRKQDTGSCRMQITMF
jgi:hypothetical protein